MMNADCPPLWFMKSKDTHVRHRQLCWEQCLFLFSVVWKLQKVKIVDSDQKYSLNFFHNIFHKFPENRHWVRVGVESVRRLVGQLSWFLGDVAFYLFLSKFPKYFDLNYWVVFSSLRVSESESSSAKQQSLVFWSAIWLISTLVQWTFSCETN